MSEFHSSVVASDRSGCATFISVVIPTYRRPEFLHELLDALTKQLPHAGTEVLVIDNCPDASAQSTVFQFENPNTHYIHESRSGVVHARNRGLAEAKGDYILFIDDDEVPAPGWLDAFTEQAKNGVVAAFGRIKTRYASEPSSDVIDMLEQMFSRKIDASNGDDITEHYAILGCGNALFHRKTCFPQANPFKEEFNRLGGEDSALIEELVSNGATLHWVNDGLVEELVPADRQSLEYLKSRRFNQGRLRSKINMERNMIRGAFWMGVGAVQTALYAFRFAFALAKRSENAAFYSVQIQGGLGKLFWWYQPSNLRTYGL